MPTRHKPDLEEREKQMFLTTMICDTAMHILHDSYLYGSDLWPANGFRAGSGWGSKIEDCIFYGVNAYGWNQAPIIGRLGFNIYNTPEKREALQVEHLRTIFDWTLLNDILFEDEFKNTSPIDRIWFKFTYTPKQ